jgi:hypothetical protein
MFAGADAKRVFDGLRGTGIMPPTDTHAGFDTIEKQQASAGRRLLKLQPAWRDHAGKARWIPVLLRECCDGDG